MSIGLLLLASIFSIVVAFIALIIFVILLIKQKKLKKKRYKTRAALVGFYILVLLSIIELQPKMVIYKDMSEAVFQGHKFTKCNTVVPVMKDLTQLDYIGMVEDKNEPWLIRKINMFIFPRLLYEERGGAEKEFLWVGRGPLNYGEGMMNYNEKDALVDQFRRLN